MTVAKITSPITGIDLINKTNEIIDNLGGSASTWGNITGTLSNQTDLQNALNGKSDTSLSNITTAGKEVITGADKPDYANYSANYVNNTEYTASANMWIVFTSEVTAAANIYGNPSSATALGQINGGGVYHNSISVSWDGGGNTVSNTQTMSIMYRLYKNDKFRLDTSFSNQGSVSAQIYTYPIVS